MDSINPITSTPQKSTKFASVPGIENTPDSATRKLALLPAFEPKFPTLGLPPSSPSQGSIPDNAFEHDQKFASSGAVDSFLSKSKPHFLKNDSISLESRERGRYFITPEPSSTLGRGLSEGDEIYGDCNEPKHPQIPSSPVFENYSDNEDDDEDGDNEGEDKFDRTVGQIDLEASFPEQQVADSSVTRLDYEFKEPHIGFAQEYTSKPTSATQSLPQSFNSSSFASPSRAKVPFNVLSPFACITATMAIPRTGKQVTLGRSSVASDFVLSSSNRLASRLHVRAEYIKPCDSETNERVKFTCEGWNGCTIVVPTFKRVTKATYMEMTKDKESATSDKEGNPEAESSFVYIPNGITDYIIPRGHNVEVDYVDGITIDIRGDIVMVKLVDNDPVKHHKSTETRKSVDPNLKRKRAEETETKPVKKQAVGHKPAKKPISELKKNDESKPLKQPKAESESNKADEKPDFSKFTDPSSFPHNTPMFDYSKVQHLVSNHLAFSRLHSTPLSSIHKSISALKGIDASDLRYVLASTPWIGVVTRQGKDAAGRPLEEEYYYVYEKDKDIDRKTMVEKIGARGAGGLRACRKTHKQYYWKMPAKR